MGDRHATHSMPPLAADPGAALAVELVQLLHQGASAEDFAKRLAEAEALPDDRPDKSALVEAVRMAMAVRNRLELLHQREQGMLAVIESAQDLSSRLDLTNLLSAIVSRARNLLGADLGWLSAYDAERGEFHVRVAEGALSRSVPAMVARSDRGVASVVMSTRLPFTTPDYLHDRRFSHDGRLDDTFRDEGITAMAGVPLIWDGEVIGLLFVADRYHRVHTAQSVSILCTLATHAAVALRNARDFERANAALAKADAARAELEGHLRGIQAAADAHEQMTSLLARGASLAALCQSVARLLGGSLLVLDEAAQVIGRGHSEGYDGSAAQRYAPNGAHSADVARALRESRRIGRSVLAYEEDGERCQVMSVIGGEDILGSIALFHRGALEDVAVRTFERSSSVIGIVLLSQERIEAQRSRGATALLRSLVSTRQDELAVMADRAARLGVDLGQPVALLLLETDGPSAAYAARRLRAAPNRENTLVDDIDGLLVMVCAATRAPETRRELEQWARGEMSAAYRGVLSRPIAAAPEIPGVYETLRRALVVLRRMGVQGHVIGQNELALYSALFETHDRASLKSFLDGTIGAVTSHDAKRGTDLAATLLCYFDSNQNAKTTAQRLGIHVNTVRQRLASLEGLIGHWGSATRALELHIALRLWSLGSAAP